MLIAVNVCQVAGDENVFYLYSFNGASLFILHCKTSQISADALTLTETHFHRYVEVPNITFSHMEMLNIYQDGTENRM